MRSRRRAWRSSGTSPPSSATAIQAPSDLKYEYLRTFELVSFQDRQVPRLTLAGPNGGQLNVYVLSTSSFTLPAERDGVVSSQGDRHVLAQRSGAFIYVYDWTGNAQRDVSTSSN